MLRAFTRLTMLLSVLLLAGAIGFAQLDPTFGVGGRFIRVSAGHESVLNSFLLPDGKFLVVTDIDPGTGPVTYQFGRFNQDGTTDLTYGTNGSVQLAIPFISTQRAAYGINDAVRQGDGKIVLVGRDNSDGLALRFNENGSLDTSFSGDGIHRPNINQQGDDELDRIIYQSDGSLVAIGRSTLNSVRRLFMMRYVSNGGLDVSFGDQGGFIVHSTAVGPVTGLVRQSSGKYVATTRPTFAGNGPSGRVYRFEDNGVFDSGFASPELDEYDAILLLRLSDDRLLLCGNPYLQFPPGDHLLRFHSDIRLTRLNANGGIDTTFGDTGSVRIDIVSGMTDTLGDVVELSDGSLAVAASTYVWKNRSPVFGSQVSVLKLTGNGGLAGRYLASPIGERGQSSSLLLQPDGRLVIVGNTAAQTPNADIMLTRLLGVPLTTPRFRGIPFEFSSLGSGPSGISHHAVFRPSETKWYASPLLVSGVRFGLATDVITAGDFYRDYQTELAVFRPSNGTWYIGRDLNATSNFVTIQWGASGDIPAAYDYDGDGKYDVTVYRPLDGNWYIRQSSDNAARIHHWGITEDKPVIGDYDGDGLGDLAVWRPLSGIWYINRSSDGQAQIAQFGLSGDVPVQEDYDGDLKTDIAVFRPSTGVWYIWRTSDNGFTIIQFGVSGDVPVTADYDGDRKMDVAVYRPSTSRWYWIRSGSGEVEEFTWGIPGDIAVQGRY